MQKTVVMLSTSGNGNSLARVAEFIDSSAVRRACLREHGVVLEYVGYSFGISDLCLILSTAAGNSCAGAVLAIRKLVDEQMKSHGLDIHSRTISIVTTSRALGDSNDARRLQVKVVGMLREAFERDPENADLGRVRVEAKLQAEELTRRVEELYGDAQTLAGSSGSQFAVDFVNRTLVEMKETRGAISKLFQEI